MPKIVVQRRDELIPTRQRSRVIAIGLRLTLVTFSQGDYQPIAGLRLHALDERADD